MAKLPPFPNEYKIIETKTSGEVRIRKNVQYNNIDAEKVTVAKGVKARLYGKVKDLVLEKDSLVYLHGSASQVTNKGGLIYTFPQH